MDTGIWIEKCEIEEQVLDEECQEVQAHHHTQNPPKAWKAAVKQIILIQTNWLVIGKEAQIECKNNLVSYESDDSERE